MLAGRPPASTNGHLYWLKVAGGSLAHQQKPVLAAKTNRFWPSVRCSPAARRWVLPSGRSVSRRSTPAVDLRRRCAGALHFRCLRHSSSSMGNAISARAFNPEQAKFSYREGSIPPARSSPDEAAQRGGWPMAGAAPARSFLGRFRFRAAEKRT
jgi:hypothetical protein